MEEYDKEEAFEEFWKDLVKHDKSPVINTPMNKSIAKKSWEMGIDSYHSYVVKCIEHVGG